MFKNVLKHFYSVNIMALFFNSKHNSITVFFSMFCFTLYYCIVLSHSMCMCMTGWH